MPIDILAFYCFTPIEHPLEEVARQKAFLEERDSTGRIYISEEGINGQMSLTHLDAESYMQWMHADVRFAAVEFKIHPYHEHVFPRLAIKARTQLVALDEKVDLSQRGEPLSPKAWRERIEQRDSDTLILDVRNAYEWEIGHFEGAELPKLESFREFPSYAKRLKEERELEKTKVMMYCTGGIRCELFSAFLKKEGFKQVYQLEGGVIKYGLEEGSRHWKGKLFVFDDRMAVSVNEKEPISSIAKCRFCATVCDVHTNCANMDCNELFLCCPSCAEKLLGCCSVACTEQPRVRPYEKGERPKPFRRSYHYEGCAKDRGSVVGCVAKPSLDLA